MRLQCISWIIFILGYLFHGLFVSWVIKFSGYIFLSYENIDTGFICFLCFRFALFDFGFGSGTLKIKAALHRVDDRRIHTVFLKVEGIKGMIQVDGREKPFAFAGYASETLDLESGLFVGGVGEFGRHVLRFPPSVWSTFTSSGFVGCFQDLTLNSVRMNLLAFAQDQETIGVIDHCEHHAVAFCSSYPCLHTDVATRAGIDSNAIVQPLDTPEPTVG